MKLTETELRDMSNEFAAFVERKFNIGWQNINGRDASAPVKKRFFMKRKNPFSTASERFSPPEGVEVDNNGQVISMTREFVESVQAAIDAEKSAAAAREMQDARERELQAAERANMISRARLVGDAIVVTRQAHIRAYDLHWSEEDGFFFFRGPAGSSPIPQKIGDAALEVRAIKVAHVEHKVEEGEHLSRTIELGMGDVLWTKANGWVRNA